MDIIKIGDIVMLKSGSPMLTVSDIDDGGILCVWFVEGEVKTYQFNRFVLQKVK
ncbi:YodC family protein [Commensalibacter communis]|uniref:YodC family protein n=1 Tax=Commensalibacter communis TaxID=2972786 RepID=UPI0022FFB4B4|nr:DUF2158 domain-containing protein [Commensalibacter communis]CAI3951565.1 unnamed protein product [Commensalibacter communis]CAI3954921.1 unnamed protein product [Commensalibacter communis]